MAERESDRPENVNSSAEETYDPNATIHLLDRIKGGDEQAMDVLLRRYLGRLQRWASGRLPGYARDLLDTEDLVQEAVINSLRQLDHFDHRWKGALHAYLRRAVMNRIQDQTRRARTRQDYRQRVPPREDDPAPSPLEELIGKDALERYEAALERLDPIERELVVARVEMDCDYKELAELLGRPSPDAARMAVGRALVKLAKEMDHGR